SWRIEFLQKEKEGFWPKGWVIADDQIDFTKPDFSSEKHEGKLEFGFDPKTGELVSLKSGVLFKTELLKEPFTIDVYRAPSQNEPNQKKLWNKAGAFAPSKKLVDFSDVAENGLRKVKSVIDYGMTGTVYRVETEWSIRNGVAEVKAKFTQLGKKFEPARIGFRTVFDFGNMNVQWLGNGPYENYSDRRSGAFLGLWSKKSKDFFFPYDVPQDSGNMEGTYFVKLDTLWDSVTFAATGKPFAYEVNPYAPEVLVRYAHPAELPGSSTTFFGIYARVRGLGGNSCGPLPIARDIVGSESHEIEFVIK
ncbi:MAG: hypothetical protein J6R18_07460, partial [Kiritimatiellae bacterium]|nr:hypothetical protein [Kiritimatiellia bacterium]